jgi:hypothetical protein
MKTVAACAWLGPTKAGKADLALAVLPMAGFFSRAEG